MNAINWFEIPVTDFERAVAFYEQLYAHPLPLDTSFPGFRMAMLPSLCPGVGGCLVEFEQARPHADGVRIYLNAGDDLQCMLDRAQAAGGMVVMPKTLVREDIGFVAMFTDSEGNIIGLHSLR